MFGSSSLQQKVKLIALKQGWNQNNWEGRTGCRHYSTIQHSYRTDKIHEKCVNTASPKTCEKQTS